NINFLNKDILKKIYIVKNNDLSKSIFLIQSPPYRTKLDRAALVGKMFNHVSLDIHVGSIAIKNFIEAKQPLITLHGHIYESARLTGSWKDKLNNTFSFTAVHYGHELALIRFDHKNLQSATRVLI
ncbi:MAG: hypothetical protein JXJ22_11050, partial [Bacteroidales bacterium]|nr:hypothetical protein [Bacteroidales bacterium]